MGKRGPAKTPTALLKKRGSWRAKKRKKEPKPDPKRPACPQWLNASARRMWWEIVPQLHKMGVVGKTDRSLLAVLCQTWAQWRRLQEFVDKEGGYYERRNDDGQITDARELPQVGRLGKLSDRLLKLFREVGMTPSGRADFAEEESNPEERRGKGRDPGILYFPKRKAQ